MKKFGLNLKIKLKPKLIKEKIIKRIKYNLKVIFYFEYFLINSAIEDK